MSSPASAVSTPPVQAPAQRPPQQLPPFRVVLHNDSVNDMLHVVESIVLITAARRADATKRMLEAHTTGAATVAVTHLEHAELMREQFASRRLSASIEPA